MPSLFNLIHLLLSFASKLNVFPSKPSFRSFIFYLLGTLLKPRVSHILSISKIILYPYQRLQYLISDSSWLHQSLSSSRISLIKDIIKSKTSPKVILIIHIHLGGDGIGFLQSNTAQILVRWRDVKRLSELM